MPVTVYTPFTTEPIEVDEEEAAVMARQGLLRDTAPEAPAQPEVVTVTTVYGSTVEVDADEAAVLEPGGAPHRRTWARRAGHRRAGSHT